MNGIAIIPTRVGEIQASPEDFQLFPQRDVAEIHNVDSFWGVPLDRHPIVQARISPSGHDMAMAVEDVIVSFEAEWPEPFDR